MFVVFFRPKPASLLREASGRLEGNFRSEEVVIIRELVHKWQEKKKSSVKINIRGEENEEKHVCPASKFPEFCL